MITKKEAVTVGTAVVDGSKREERLLSGSFDRFARVAARGAALNAIGNIWYDVLPLSVREKIGTHRDYLVACGWDRQN